MTPDPTRYGFAYWRPVVTKAAIEANNVGPCALFSNTLSWGETTPSERAHNAGFTVYTIEFDHAPLTEQLGIIWSGRLKRIHGEFCRFRDYRGYEAVYSGNKSVHFHFCFDLRHLKRDLIVAGNSSYVDNWTRDLPDSLLRPAYEICWYRLAATFHSIAEIDDEPDPGLRRWEQLRRGRWGLRQIRSGHPLGLPADHRVPQVVLAQDIFKNTKRRATEFKFTRIDCDVLFEQHAPEMFRRIIGAEYPKFVCFDVNEAGFRCYFRNGPDDSRPSSFCDGNRDRIVLQGRHSFGSDGVALGSTPNQIFDWIISQHAHESNAAPDDWIVRRYQAAVHDRGSLARFLDDHIVDMIAPHATSAIPAGIFKQSGQRENPNTHVVIRGP